MKLSATEIEKELEQLIKNFDGKALDLTTLCGALLLINRLKAENKNCGVKIQNQREQLKACNEKIKRLEFQADGLNEAYEESVKEAKSGAYKEFAEACKKVFPTLAPVFDVILKEMGCEGG